MAQNADQYFFEKQPRQPQQPQQPQQPLQYETVILQQSAAIERLEAILSVDRERLRKLNPALTRSVWRGWRLVPAGYNLRLPVRQENWTRELQLIKALPPESSNRTVVQYTVKRGDTACAIASTFQVNCPALISFNRLNRNALIRVGQQLQISPALNQRGASSDLAIYRVRAGESICGISKRFATNCNDLLTINGLTRKSIIQIGQEIVIPVALRALGLAQSYTVQRGDSACLIAARFRVPCQLLMTKTVWTGVG